MENLIHKITVGEWNYYSKSGDLFSLKKYGITSKNIVELDGIISEQLNEIDFDKEIHRISSKYIINELMVYYKTLKLLMVHKLNIELLMLEAGIKNYVNIELDSEINTTVKNLKELHNININNVSDLEKLNDSIERNIDKFNENFEETETEIGITFSDLIIQVFKILNYREIDYLMVLSDFFGLVNQVKTIKKT